MLTVEEQSYGLRHNGITVSVAKWDSHKNPVLSVRIDGENRVYKVASFNSAETANWFVELMQEFFEGLVRESK